MNKKQQTRIIELAKIANDGIGLAIALSDDDYAPEYRNVLADFWRYHFIKNFDRKGYKYPSSIFSLESDIERKVMEKYKLSWYEAKKYCSGKSIAELTIEFYGQEFHDLYQRTLNMQLFTFYETFYQKLIKNIQL